MASAKFNFGLKVQQLTTTLINEIDDGIDVEGVWADRGYVSGGTDPITATDIAGLNMTVAQLTSMITAFQQLKNYIDNVVVVQGDYRASFNAVRNDL